MSEPIIPIRTYSIVFGALLVLAALTTGLAYLDLGPFNTVFAVLIATCKMLLVALFFMHLRFKPGLTRIASVIGLLWLALLVSLTLTDVFTRHWTAQGKPW